MKKELVHAFHDSCFDSTLSRVGGSWCMYACVYITQCIGIIHMKLFVINPHFLIPSFIIEHPRQYKVSATQN